jgi:release factor glutamine methyltransferase
VLDLGTGTGCLLLSVLTEYPQASGIGIDLAPDAALLARRNAVANGLADRAGFLAGHWADAIQGRFDLVLSNPPYIPSADIAGLMPEVCRYEPSRALNGGADGLDAYRTILHTLPNVLHPNGWAVLELGIGQAKAVGELACRQGFATTVKADLSGIPRALVLHTRR